MKIFAVVLAFASAALGIPAAVSPQDLAAITNELSFKLPLPAFTARRNKRDPPFLDWTSDGCSYSPDNPFGFPFLPGCHRHDFGYHNFRRQKRFSKANKNMIDLQFRNDLYGQCRMVAARTACERLADVYFAAVQMFGGKDSTKRDTTYAQAYAEAVEAYDAAVKKAQEEGLLPVLDKA